MKVSPWLTVPLLLLVALVSCPPPIGAPDGVYNLTIVKKGENSYSLEGNKTPGQPYRPSFGGQIEWNFTNETGAPAKIALSGFRCVNGNPVPGSCPLNFRPDISQPGCVADTGFFEHANPTPKPISAYVGDSACDFSGRPFPGFELYDFEIRLTPQGAVERPIDPQIQIDRGGGLLPWLRRLIAILALLGAGVILLRALRKRRRPAERGE
jgi:hypothetical protein